MSEINLMSKFNDEMNTMAKKSKNPGLNSVATYPISYPTTLLPLDYMNGMRVEIDSINDRNFIYDSIGLGEGSINMFIGKTGSAKSSMVIQIATSIVAPFKNSMIVHEDPEGGSSYPRIKTLSGWSSKYISTHYNFRQAGIDSDSFFKRTVSHCKLKMELANEHPNEFLYFTGTFDVHGNPVYKIIPSVIILDSLALLSINGKTKDEELEGNMSASQNAKMNAQIFKRLAQPLKLTNTILLIINHLNSNIKLNPYDNKGAQINYLSMDETIPGLVTLPVSS